MSVWEAAVLSDVLLEARSGFACGEDVEDGVLQFRMNNITSEGQIDLTKKRRVPRDTRNIDSFLVEQGDVLFNATNSPELVGKTAYLSGLDEPAVFSNHFLRLRPNAALLDGRFLWRWLNLQFEHGKFKGMCRQWVNQATVNRDALLGLRLPLPPLLEQRRIAETLDKADALRANCREGIAALDALTRSVFFEMFGDPTTNPKRWPRQPLGNIGDVVTGNTPSRQISDYYGSAIEWIKSDNIDPGSRYLTRALEGLSLRGKDVSRVAPPGSILVTCIAGSPNSIGNAAIADREVAFNQQINAIVPHNDNTNFLFTQFLVGKRLIQAASTASMKGMVSKSRLEAVSLINPPLDLQRAFGKRFDGIERVRRSYTAMLSELGALFSSLQQRAFAASL